MTTTNTITTLHIVSRYRQIDGSVRYVLDAPAPAAAARQRIRLDPARAEGERGSVIVDVDARDRRSATEWPGRRDGAAPPWEAIAQALIEAL